MAEAPAPVPPVDTPDTPPPLFGSWRNVYIGIVLYLLTLILLFYAFRKAFEG